MKKTTKMKILAVSLAVILTACGGAEERKAKYMEKGKNYFVEKNYDKAKIEFKNVMQIDPKFAEAYYYIGQIEEQSRDLQKSAANYQQALQLAPEHVDAKVKLAKIYTIVGTEEYLGQARKLLQEVKTIKPDHNEAALVDAVIDLKQGNKDQALEKLRQVIQKDSSQVEAYSLMASIFATKGQDDDVINILNMGIKENPNVVSLRMMQAQSLVKNSRDLPSAEVQLKKIIEIEPDNYNSRVALATFYATSNQPDKAESVLRQAIADDEEDVRRYLVLVEYLATKKSAKMAEDELLTAIKKKPDMYELRFALVKFYQELQLVDKAIEVLNFISDKQDYEPEGIKAKVQLADIYLTKGDFSESQKIITDVLEEKPNDTSALLISAKLAFQKQDDQTVINALRTVLKDEPKNSDAALLLAQAHERNKETELAKEVLMRALEADPLNPKNHLNYANFQLSKNDIKLAMDTLDKALAYFKADYDLMEGKLRLLAAGKDEQATKALLDQLKVIFPDKEEVFMQRGQYYVAKKQFESALAEFETALKNSRTVYKPLEAVVQMHMVLKQEQKAIDLLQARLTVNADDVIANQLLGQVYASRNDMNKALDYFNKAMKNGKWEVPYMSAASVYLAQKNMAGAQAVLEKGVAQASNPVQIQLQLATLHEMQKNYDKAIAVYEEIVAVNPANQMAANNLASLLLDARGDQNSSMKALELTAGFAKSRHPALMDTLGWATLKNNDTAKAISVLEEVNRIAPDVGVFQFHLGMAYHQAGDTANAKRYLSLAVASKQDYLGKDLAKEALKKL